jgi:hypothetical protein
MFLSSIPVNYLIFNQTQLSIFYIAVLSHLAFKSIERERGKQNTNIHRNTTKQAKKAVEDNCYDEQLPDGKRYG